LLKEKLNSPDFVKKLRQLFGGKYEWLKIDSADEYFGVGCTIKKAVINILARKALTYKKALINSLDIWRGGRKLCRK
jgi:hypothetical protein